MGVAVSAGENEVSVKPGNTGRVRDAARTRTALLDAAREVFLRDGRTLAAATTLGGSLSDLFGRIETQLDGATGAAAP